MRKAGDSSRMTVMKVGGCEDNTEVWRLFKNDVDEGWELFNADED